jgi:hypothetical protein
MNRRGILGISAMMALGLVLAPSSAVSQQKSLKDQLVGTWSLVSWESFDAAGAKIPAFEGTDLKGLLVLTDSGRLSFQAITESPKLASNARLRSTPAEDKAVAHAVLSYFGTYTVSEADKSFTIRIERSSFPNQNGIDAKRIITTLTADELKYTNPARLAGGKVNLAWRRAK